MAKQKRWNIVNASRSKQEVHEDIMKIFGKKIGI
jgi:dTMP kinase